jgi:hypothetical protein
MIVTTRQQFAAALVVVVVVITRFGDATSQELQTPRLPGYRWPENAVRERGYSSHILLGQFGSLSPYCDTLRDTVP